MKSTMKGLKLLNEISMKAYGINYERGNEYT